jgi:hypothetical protein
MKTKSPAIAEYAIQSRLLEIERERTLYGDSSTVLIVGCNCDEIQLSVLLGRRMICAKFIGAAGQGESIEKSSRAIPAIKAILSDICPTLQYEDVKVKE